MPGPFAPSDSLVGPIVSNLTTFINTQIPAVGYIYPTLPDRPPADDAVVMPLLKITIVSETNGKLKLSLSFAMRHLFRRTNLQDDIARAYTFIVPWLNVLGAWQNQTLSGLAMEVDAKELTVMQVTMGGQVLVALGVNFNVVTEINIVLT